MSSSPFLIRFLSSTPPPPFISLILPFLLSSSPLHSSFSPSSFLPLPPFSPSSSCSLPYTGFALIIEGIMSAMYHICPTYANFQFGKLLLLSSTPHLRHSTLLCAYTAPKDTSVMFIIGGLIIFAILQGRHTDTVGKAFFAFFMFSLITLVTIMGLVSGLFVLTMKPVRQECIWA